MKEILNYLKYLFDIDSNTLATILITISVFILGYLFNHLNNVLIAYSERKVLRKITRTGIKKLIQEVDNQMAAFEKIESNLIIDNRNSFQFTTVTMGALKAIQGIGYEKMYRCFFSGVENIFRRNDTRLKSFTSFWNLLETLSKIDESLQPDYKDLRSSYLLINEQRNLLSIQIQKIVDDNIVFFVTNPHIPELMDYLSDFNSILSAYAKLPDNNLPSNVQNYHQSLKPLANKHMTILKKYENDLNIHQLMPLVSEASYRFSELQQLLFINRDSYQQLTKSFKSYSDELTKTLKELN